MSLPCFCRCGGTVGLCLALAALAACGGGSSAGGAAAPPAPPQAGLARFASAAELEDYLEGALRRQAGQPPPAAGEVDFSPGAPADVSSTNLQEIGVDEADRIKTDGRHLYVLESPVSIQTLDAGLLPDPGPSVARLRVLALSAGPPAATPVATLAWDDGLPWQGAYLVTAATEPGWAGPELLATLGASGTFYPYADAWFAPQLWRQGQVELRVLDVADPAAPVQRRRLGFDGQLVASRRIGSLLYLVLRHSAAPPEFIFYPAGAADQAHNERVLAASGLPDLLPDWRLDGVPQGDVVQAQDCSRPSLDTAPAGPDLLLVVAVDLLLPDGPAAAACLTGPSETLYASPSALYLATAGQPYALPAAVGDEAVYPPEFRTDIHKFALTAAGPVYRGSGSVPGHLGWEQGQKSFRMGERGGVLRVASSLGEVWDGDPSTRVTLLAEANGRLDELSHLPNAARPEPIGKPGERLYAARFVGERAYLVTFRVIDPLYVVDLSAPTDPRLAGSLELPGYAAYLHPLSDTLVLGVGKDAVPDGGVGDGRGAWFQGLKLALFDVSDPAAPRLADSLVLGERGTESDLLFDHHALAWLPAAPGRPARLALPVRLHDIPPSQPGGAPWEYHQWRHTGLYLFEIHDGGPGPAGLRARGAVVAADLDRPGYDDGYYGEDRAVLQGEAVHYLHGNGVWSAPWADPGAAVGPQ